MSADVKSVAVLRCPCCDAEFDRSFFAAHVNECLERTSMKTDPSISDDCVDAADAVDAVPVLEGRPDPSNQSQLDKFQTAAVNSDPHKPLIILAGPGSGKTTTLCSRICFLVEQCNVEPRHVLAITFSNRAANDMRQKLNVLRPHQSRQSFQYKFVTIKTFHAFCLNVLRETDRIDKHASVLDSTDQKKLIKQCLGEYATAQAEQSQDQDDSKLRTKSEIKSKSQSQFARKDNKVTKNTKETKETKETNAVDDETDFASPITPAQVKKAYNHISRDKMRLRTPNHYAIDSERRQVWEMYEQKKKISNAVDFDDMLCLFVDTLRGDKGLQRRIRTRFPYVLVDEYQGGLRLSFFTLCLVTNCIYGCADTNGLQLEVTKLLSPNISIVGDDDQSIYGWRGAEVRNWSRFKSAFPGSREVQLVNNYRSGRSIVAVCNALIGSNDERLKQQQMVCLPEHSGSCIVASCYNMTEEAEVVATEIVALHNARGIPYREMSILYRSNPQSILSRALEKSLLSHEIPYVIVRGTELFERKIIKDVLAFCTLIVNPKDNLAFSRIFTLVPGLGKLSWCKFRKYAERWSKARERQRVDGSDNSVPWYLPSLLSWDFRNKTSQDQHGVRIGLTGRALKQLAHLQSLFVKWNTFTKDASVEEDRCAGDVMRLVIDDVKMQETFKEDEDELVDILIVEASRPEKFTDIEFGISDTGADKNDVKSDRQPVPGSGARASAKRTAFDRLHLFLERVSFGEVMKGGKRIGPRTQDQKSFPSKPASGAAATTADEKSTDHADVDCVTLSTIHSAKGLEWRCVFGLHLADGTFPRYKASSSDDDSDQEAKGTGDKDRSQNRLEEERRVAYVLCSRAKEVLHLSVPKLPFNKQPFASPSVFIEEIREKCAQFVVFRENAAAHVRKRAQERDKKETDDKRKAQALEQEKKEQRQHEREQKSAQKPDESKDQRQRRKPQPQNTTVKREPRTRKRPIEIKPESLDTTNQRRNNFFAPVQPNGKQWSCDACTLINPASDSDRNVAQCRLCGAVRASDSSQAPVKRTRLSVDAISFADVRGDVVATVQQTTPSELNLPRLEQM